MILILVPRLEKKYMLKYLGVKSIVSAAYNQIVQKKIKGGRRKERIKQI